MATSVCVNWTNANVFHRVNQKADSMQQNDPGDKEIDSGDQQDPGELEQQSEHDDDSSEIQFLDDTIVAANLAEPEQSLDTEHDPDVIVVEDTTNVENMADENSEEIPLASEVHEIRDLENAKTVAENRRFNPHVYAAKGGAYGSIALGLFSILGAFISSASALTGMLGILLALWGFNSKSMWWAVAGLVISLTGFFLSIILTQMEMTIV